ncbi:MAG: hypothetical protein AAF604_04520 [Acidobacteriota bacterium]
MAEPIRRDLRRRAFVRRFDEAITPAVREMRRTFRDAVAILVTEIGIDELKKALEDGTLERLLTQHAAWGRFAGLLEEDGRPILSRVLTRAARAAGETTQTLGKVWTRENMGDIAELLEELADRQIGALVTGVTEQTRFAIRDLVGRALREEPTTVRAIQRALLALDGEGGRPRLGLDRQRQRVFDRYMADLLDPEGAGKGLSSSRIQQLLDRRYRGLLRARTGLIARTEANAAGNRGQFRVWEWAADQGDLDGGRYVLEWVTRVINVCPRCVAMDRATREVRSGLFVSDGSGPKGVEAVTQPELHPGGYCQARTVLRPR